MNKKSLFEKVIVKGILGAVIGIFAGLVLGLGIWGLLLLVAKILQEEMGGGPPGSVFAALGMCFGALLGSLHGAAVAIREEKK